MGLEETLNETLTRAMKDKDQRTADVVRMLKTRVMERKTSKGFAGTVDDALVLDVIGAYRKQLQKALAEFEKVGERGAEMREKLRFEVDYCAGWLPKGLSADEIRTALAEIIGRLGAADPKMAGKVMGEFMKTHRGLADGKEVKAIAEELLAPK